MVSNEIIRIARVGLQAYAKELKSCGYNERSIQDSINALALDVVLDVSQITKDIEVKDIFKR